MASLKTAGKRVINRTFGGTAVKAYVGPSLTKTGKEVIKAVYKTKDGGYVTKRKSGRTSQKDPVAAALNRYYSAGGKKAITWIYSAKSRVIRRTDTMLAVRAGKEKGWIDSEGRFLSEKKLRDSLYAIDSTLVSAVKGISLLSIYDSMTPAQRAEFAEKTRNIDWDAFWDEMYTEEGAAPFDRQLQLYTDLIYELGVSAGW